MTTEEIEPVGFINAQGGFLLTDAGAEWFKAALASVGPAPVGVTALPLYASLPPARVEEGPKVKALRWQQATTYSFADSEVGEYSVQHYSESDGPGWHAVLNDGCEIGDFPTDLLACAACQADYEARIWSALE